MDWTSIRVPYRQTGYFSRIMTDYLDKADGLSPFYNHPVTPEGVRSALEARRNSPVNRQVLVRALEDQYKDVRSASRVTANIARLGQENTFTVCTAHQPAIFTGPLYFIYKILHTIRLADSLAEQYPQYQFVPIFFMGSEDADIDELGHIYLGNEKLEWETRQKGAVGRMQTKGLERLLDRIDGQLSVQPFGKEIITLLRETYLGSPDVQTATFRFLHRLFAEFGLVVLIPDRASLKKLMLPVFEDDLFRQSPSRIVGETIDRLSEQYKVQANPRSINLFYLKDELRNRIEKKGDEFFVHESTLRFTEAELKDELQQHPERFSPNVILRGLFQEMILPNIAFIGGGGETAYWLELKGLFTHYKTPFPLLIIRNSFLLVERPWVEKMNRIGLEVTDLFQPAEDLVNRLVKKESRQQLDLAAPIAEANRYYESLKALAQPVDPTLVQHVAALQTKALEPVRALEKKLLKAEKRKFGDQQRQVHALKSALFPLDGLQERIENFLPWYAARGPRFIRDIYQHSLGLEQEFVVLTEE